MSTTTTAPEGPEITATILMRRQLLPLILLVEQFGDNADFELLDPVQILAIRTSKELAEAIHRADIDEDRELERRLMDAQALCCGIAALADHAIREEQLSEAMEWMGLKAMREAMDVFRSMLWRLKNSEPAEEVAHG